jgi:hypothetical protein
MRLILPPVLRLLRPFLVPLVAMAAAVAASPALAQAPVTSNETFKTMLAGKWEISNADRDRTCQLTFRSDPAGALFKLELDKACAAQMPELKDVTGWTIGGLDLVKLMDGKGKAVFEFSEVENSIFEAQRPGEGVFFMQNSTDAAAATNVSLDQMAGDWGVVRGSGGKTVCVITLSKTAAGDSPDAFALSLKPGCQNFVTGFGPAAWYLDRGELVLKSSRAGRYWRFEAASTASNQASTTWQRVPEGHEPVNLVRQ